MGSKGNREIWCLFRRQQRKMIDEAVKGVTDEKRTEKLKVNKRKTVRGVRGDRACSRQRPV